MHAFPEVTQGETLAIHAAGELVLPQDLSEPAHVDRAAQNLSIACSGVAQTLACAVPHICLLLADVGLCRGADGLVRVVCLYSDDMRAVVITKPGGPEVLELQQVETPPPGLAKCWCGCMPRR